MKKTLYLSYKLKITHEISVRRVIFRKVIFCWPIMSKSKTKAEAVCFNTSAMIKYSLFFFDWASELEFSSQSGWVINPNIMLRYSAYPTIPSKAEITISMIGETLFFNIFFCPKYTVQRIAVMMTALMLIFSKELSYKFLKIIQHPVASIIPIILGLIPRRAAWTYLFLITLGRTAVTANIIKTKAERLQMSQSLRQ